MALNVFTNVSNLNAQRNLSNNQAGMAKSLQRLSSGMRINSAADDAAGLTISSGLTAQVRGLNQASRNASDGLSLLGTTESAIQQQTDLMQRLRELAVQAASDTNNGGNRADLHNEATQLKTELERIARTTSFNGLNLLDGSFQGKSIQVGANSTTSDRISMDMGSTKMADLGAVQITTSGSTTDYTTTSVRPPGGYSPASNILTLTVGGTPYTVPTLVNDGVSTVLSNESALAEANAINSIKDQTGVTATATTSFVVGGYNQTAGTIVSGDLKVNNVNVGAVTVTNSTDNSVVDAINAVQDQTGVTAAWDSSNQLVISAADGRMASLTFGNSARACGFPNLAGYEDTGTVTLHSANPFTIGGTLPDFAGFTAGAVAPVITPTTTTTTQTVGSLDLTTKAGAQLAIQIADSALAQLSSRRAGIGALTNRLNSTISSLSSASENASAASSRILDTDFAAETAHMSRSQVLQQAGVAILAQANQAPQLALSLLR